ncbi:MAG: hypothetical protein KAQ98_09145, partial [Bacteriovoracaceae bacterium]|nr:hypothetical protein [Bacteriovoracaceae bacterium]
KKVAKKKVAKKKVIKKKPKKMKMEPVVVEPNQIDAASTLYPDEPLAKRDDDDNTVDGNENEVSFDDVSEKADGFSQVNNNASGEYNPDDEQDDEAEGQYGYGWGYNDAFDKVDEGKTETETQSQSQSQDEDESYVQGGVGEKKED